MLCVAAFLSAVPASAGELPVDLGKRLTTGYISPAMQGFHRAADRLNAALQGWCVAPDKAGAQRIDKDFAQLITSWAGIEFLRFGPLVKANRYEKLNFWPDPRGITLRQVQGVLTKPDAIPNASELSAHSVAIQGLPALEYVLYREGGLLAGLATDAPIDSVSPEACSYAMSVAGNLEQLGSEIASEWRPGGIYAQQFARPSEGNSLYRSQQEVAAEAIKALSTGLQFARDIKLLPMLGDDIEAARPKRAPFWRSGQSMASMAASAQGMLRFYRAGGYQYGSDEAWVDDSVQAELRRIEGVFQAMQTGGGSADFIELAGSEDGYRQLTLAAILIKNAKSQVDEHVAPAFGVRIGFNALDGD
ncbi:aminopeptidase [Pollutimonas subterranea]|uniref:Aminopeptidase n=2 Tax=Pollutimonas subterranea TaxID=2045210 RepID=A0A2N4U9I4_9BURK|nr:aminopeptidase [Pollutimonas subterranea]